MANSTLRAADDTFGPFVEPIARTSFDFTLLFEQSIFSIGPSALLLLVAPFRILCLSRSPRRVARSPLAIGKLLLLAILTILHAANFALWTTPAAPRTRVSIAAATLSFAATVGLDCLSYMEHVCSIRPSPIINAYLLFTLPLDFAQVRTLWLRGSSAAVAAVFSTTSAVKVAVLIAEAVEKGGLLLSPFTNDAPESTSGIYSRALFWWLNPLFLLGYKEVLSNDSLLATDGNLMSRPVYHRFLRQWAKSQSAGGKFALLQAMTQAMLLPLAAGIVPRLCLIFFRYMQPFLIHRVSNLVAQPVNKYTTNQGWGLTAAYGLVYAAIAFSQAIYYHQTYRMITMTRGALVTIIYAKTIELSTTALNESAAVTLMSTDVQSICDALAQLHEVWASIIEIALGIWLLTREIGLALLGPLGVTIASVFATMAVSSRMGPAQKAWMEGIQSRIDVTSKMLESMKGVKMLGLTPTMSALVRGLRKHEVTLSLKFRKLLATCITLANVSATIAPGVAFIIYVIINRNSDQTLDVSQAFTGLSLISLVSGPVASLIFAVPPLMGSLGCVERIQSFLSSETRNDHRIILASSKSREQDRRPLVPAMNQDIELQTMTPKTKPSSEASNPIHLLNATFSWSVNDLPVVKDVSFELRPGSFMFIVGPVGCGKSTLLKGILGEVPSSKGFVYVDSLQTAFLDQSSWIQHKSFRKNVLGTSVFNRKWYDTVIRACALDGDIAELPQSDLTLVGSAGHSLSGGQKLRLALARAVYSRYHILILDDAFSGLDAESEDAISTRLLGKQGLLRQLGVTVLLVTHAAHRLSYADHIIALAADGTISEQARHKTENEDVNEQPAAARATKDSDGTRGAAPDELVRPLGDIQVYKYYFAAVGWLSTAAFFVLIMCFAFFSRCPDLWMKFWTSAVAEHGNSVNGTYLGVFVSLGVIALLCVFGVAFHVFTSMVPTSATNLHEDLLCTVMSAPWAFFTSTQTGQTLNRFSQDMTLVDMELPSSLIQVSGPFCLGVVQAVFICLSAAYFVATLPLVLLVMYFLQKYYLRTSRQIRLLDLEAKSPLYSHFLETLNGLATIRAFGWAEEFEDQNFDLLDKSQKPFYLLFCIQRWLSLVLDLIVAALAVILMVIVVKLRHRLDPGLVALGLLNVMSFNNNLTAIIQMWTGLETSLGAIARLKNFNERTRSENFAEECIHVPENWPSNGRLEFSNISAAYAHELPSVIKNVNLTIAPGEKVGICGVSGSGKSSLIATLFRMLETSEGSISIDDIDLSQIPRQTIRSRLNAIPQDSFFLKGTIRKNIDPLAQSSDIAIEAALRKVGLWTTITSTTSSLDTEMNAEELLSHGQRQLFCLARAMLKQQAKIVVLDEATASVDLQTDELMQKIIRESFKDCTIIAVAHRLQTIVDFDRIIVMQSGRVVEQGQPQELLANANSSFRRLWDA